MVSSRKQGARGLISASRNGSRRAASSRHREATKSRRGEVSARHTDTSVHRTEMVHIDPQYQATIRNFELGIRAFQKENYEKAKEIFGRLAGADIPEVAERARVHLRLCEQRLIRQTPMPKSAEGFYTLGVAALNSGEFGKAIEFLTKAQKMAPKLEHIRYALASAHALQGNTDQALVNLKTSIDLRPANRVQARNDEDFSRLAQDPRFKELLYPS
jgi:tetratricopeptide (TPR) repeat protein